MDAYLKGTRFEFTTEKFIASTLKNIKGSATELKAFGCSSALVLKAI